VLSLAGVQVISENRLSNSFLGNLIEICVVTADHRRVMEGMVRLGIGPWRVHTFDSSTVTERTYRGEPAEYVLRVCFAEADNVVWEIMQPVDGPTILQDFLEEHGEGIHHVAFDCAGARWEKRLAAFASRGFQLTQSGRFAGQNEFAFFGTESATGTTFETSFPRGSSGPSPRSGSRARRPETARPAVSSSCGSARRKAARTPPAARPSRPGRRRGTPGFR
jgi:methylmalonyl-CoA/ethylmalonyl-CoA epimerase